MTIALWQVRRTGGRIAVVQKRETVMAANPNPIDIHVGSRVRLRRTLLGMSQDKLVYRTRFLGHKFVSCGGPE